MMILCFLFLQFGLSCSTQIDDGMENILAAYIDDYIKIDLSYEMTSIISLPQFQSVKELSICLWIKPFWFQGSSTIFSLWAQEEEPILIIALEEDKLELSDSSPFIPLNSARKSIQIREWIHICVVHDGDITLFTTIPGSHQEVFHFIPSPLKIGNTTMVISKIGADFGEYDPLIGMIADVRLFWSGLNSDDIHNISKFGEISKYYIAVLNASDQLTSNYGIGLKRVLKDNILQPYMHSLIWYFDSKVSCEDALKVCKKFGGNFYNISKDSKNILDEYMEYKGIIDSFWLALNNKEKQCIKGTYKNGDLKISYGNFTKLSTLCVISKTQPFYLRGVGISEPFFAIPNFEPAFKTIYDYNELYYDTNDAKVYLKYSIYNNTFKEAFISDPANLVGRHLWTSTDNEKRTSKVIFSICTVGQFTCSSGECIDINDACNLLRNCEDESDEEFCEVGIEPTGFYDKRLAPFREDGSIRQISVELMLLRVVEVNMNENTITLNLKINAIWRDPRLKFKYLTSNKTTLIDQDISRKYWSPRITMETAIPAHRHLFNLDTFPGNVYATNFGLGKLTIFNSYEAYIYKGSEVTLNHNKTEDVIFVCQMNLFLFPFDSQKCEIAFKLERVLANDVEWNNSSVTVSVLQRGKLNLYSSLEFYIENESFTKVDFNITFSVVRENKAYILNTFLPCIVLEVIGILTFFMPYDDYNDRVNVNLSCLIVMAGLFTQISSSLPSTSAPKMIDIWMFFHVFLLFLVFLFNVLEMYLHHKAVSEAPKPKVQKEQSIVSNNVLNQIKLKHNSMKLPSPNKLWAYERKSESMTSSWSYHGIANGLGLMICTLCYFVFLFVFFYVALIQE